MVEQRKRWHSVEAKPGELKAAYGNDRHNGLDVYYANGVPGTDRPDARVLAEAFEGTDVFAGKSLRQVLIDRGYDIRTLRFSIQKLPTPPSKGSDHG